MQRVTLQGFPTAGQFQLTFNGQTTAPIAFGASALDVQTALENLSNINVGDVNVVAGAGSTWDIEFRGAFAGQNQPPLTGSKNEIQRIPAPAAGRFTLTFGGQTTAIIPFDASAATVQTELEALSNIDPGDVLVTGNADGSWNVEFRQAFANQDVAALSLQSNEIQRVTLQGGSAGGSFTLTFNGQTTGLLPANASAADVTAALEGLAAINPGEVAVTGPAGGPYDVEFLGQFAGQDVNSMTVTRNELQLLVLPGAPTSGTFTLTFNGQTTLPISVNASPGAVQLALEALGNIAVGDVLVTGATGAWRVEFRQALGGQNVSLLSGNTSSAVGGVTAGAYQLQLRLRELDELGGSTVRFAKIANAVNGIAVFGQPTHSPLTGEAAEVNSITNDLFGGAQFIGNLLNSDRGARSIAGNISGITDVDWYSFDIQYDATQGIAGVSTAEDWWSTVFDIDYADGFARPNLLVSVFDSLGNLVASSRDSNVADDRPNPLNGNDVADLLRGSAGGADPFIGPTELPQGRYFVAVSADNRMPSVLDQFTNPSSGTPLVRLEPANHVQRIVEDHISTDGGMTGSDPLVLNFIDPATSFIPWNLHDVTLFVSRDRSLTPNFADNSTQLLTLDPFSGLVETTVGNFAENIGDMAMHPDGRLFAYTLNTEGSGAPGFADALVGNYIQINTGNASLIQVGDDGIITHEQDPAQAMPAPVVANDIGNNNRVGEGVHFIAMDIGRYPNVAGVPNPIGFAVGGRDPLPGRGTDIFNVLYAFLPDTGAATSLNVGDRTGNALLPGPLNTAPAGTQIVERGVLNTLVDAIPTGAADVLSVVEATQVVLGTGATTFLILDDYPPGVLPPEIPPPPATPNPTTFALTYGGPATVFEYDAGPEALFNIDGNTRVIRDGQGFTVNAASSALVEFDTGHVLNVTAGAGGGNFNDGTTLTLVSPDPNGGAATINTVFEFDDNGTVTAGNVAIATNGQTTPALMAARIRDVINAQGITTRATILPASNRITLANNVLVHPGINPLDDTSATIGTSGVALLGNVGVAATSIRVRIEETSLQTELIQAFNLANATTNNRPLNGPRGVSDPALLPGGDNRITIGFDGNRVNVSGANTINNAGLLGGGLGVFRPVNSTGGVSLPTRISVPFLAQDSANLLAQRMAAAINLQLNPLSSAFAQGGSVVAPGGNFTSADPPLASAAQAPGGVITGMTSVPIFDINGNIVGSNLYCVSDTGGLFRIINQFSAGGAALDYISTAVQLLDIDFSGLEVGPNLVEGNRYRNMLFGVTEDGMLHAFDTNGIPQAVFNSAFDGTQMSARSSMQLQAADGTPLNNVNGVAFSTLGRNLWQQTPNTSPTNAHRQNDDGHGIETVVDDSRLGVAGGSSIHFGNGTTLQTTAGIDAPGGSHGSFESALFDLTRYSSADNPVLYFNYFLETENVGHGALPMRDAIRVFISGDDGVWHLLTTNDSTRLPGLLDDDFDFSPLRVKDTFDDTNNWRQARVELADFAGQNNLKLRFDFSTAGSFNMGDRSTPTNGDELRAIDAIYLRDGQNFTLSAGGDTANPTRRFEFDAGFTLVALDGAATPDGGRFTINGVTFEFNSTGGVGAGFTPVNFSTTDSSATMAVRIAAAIGGITPTQRNGNRVNLRGGAPGAVTGATSVTSVGMPASFIEGAAGVTAGSIPVNIHLAMTRLEVREAIALVLANVYTGGDRTQIKTHNEIIRLIGSNFPIVIPPPPAPQVPPPQFGFRFVDQSAGPNNDSLNQRLLGVSDFLPGDDWGAFNSNLRGQNNVIEGIYIDDIIIGLAERGELVSGVGSNNQTFVANPSADPNNIVAGAYQLEIRKGAEVAVPTGSNVTPRLSLLPSIDSNDRLTDSRALLAPAGSSIFDGQFFTLSDGINSLSFEFVDVTIAGSGPAQGRIRIDYRPNDTAPVVAQRIRAAINSAPAQAAIKVQAQLADGVLGTNNTGNQINLLGSVSVPNPGGLNFLTFGFNFSTLTERVGDRNLFRDQGQIILQGNEIKDSSQWGILIDAEPRRAVDGNSAHNGPNRNLRELSADRFVPGVVVVNNVIHNNGLGGLRISGDNAVLAPDAPVPFARAVNNTFFGKGGSLTGGNETDIGIRVDETAAPTLLNNIVANFNVGVSVDASSQTGPLGDRTVLGGMLFQGNDTNANVPIGSGFPIVLSNNQPLFVNAAAGNFYPKALSPAIDSSVDSLLDRPSLVTVRNPLGIPPSPIISPNRDNVGQLRVDDPGVSTPQGQGLNPFKDRGAIDRVDFTGPTGGLINPPDNDSDGLDLDPAPNVVVRTNTIIRDFRIRLFDRADPSGPPEGSDVDDLSISGAKVKLETVVGATTTLLLEGRDYSFSYDATNNLIVLTPLGGLWPLSTTYRITLDNSPATGITDKAGNLLQANQIDGSHTYTIFLGSAIDWGDAPATFPTLAANNGANHQVVAGVRLGATVGADTDGQPSAAANLDSSDDGVTNIVLSRGALSSFTVIASSVGKVDAWLDLDRDGVFDLPGEYIVPGFNITTPDVEVPVSFTLPNGPQGSSILRVRFSTAGIGTPDGPAPDGEVEDYLVTMAGPAFNNPTLAEDVDNNGIVNVIDLLIEINIITFLSGQLLPGFSVMTLPITSPPYQPTTPTFDPTGGGIPGQGRFVDVAPSGGNFGQVDPLDLLAIVTYLTVNFNPGGGGEGEAVGGGGSAPSAAPGSPTGSGSSAGAASSGLTAFSTSDADAGSGSADSIFPTAMLFASPSVVIEERLADTASDLGDDSWLDGGTDETLELLATSAPLDSRTLGLSLSEHASRTVPYGPLDEDAWDNLLDDLSLDVGGLPGDDLAEDQN
ncbi:MAG: GEVED domain-containing protein [Planctomycetaceae bacterium]|nr:GEVED domain-containing protein [Planctomycetaceae bacterium]